MNMHVKLAGPAYLPTAGSEPSMVRGRQARLAGHVPVKWGRT
jgi:hypothetical protein